MKTLLYVSKDQYAALLALEGECFMCGLIFDSSLWLDGCCRILNMDPLKGEL